MPARQDLGEILLLAGRYGDAERAFREDLDHFPKNGWSLHGLAAALWAQGKDEDAKLVDTELARAWANADVVLTNLLGG